MAEHAGIGGICQRAITLPSLDASAQFVGFGRAPGRFKIVVVFAEVPNRFRTNTTGPHTSVWGNLGRCHTGQGDHLALLDQRTSHPPLAQALNG